MGDNCKTCRFWQPEQINTNHQRYRTFSTGRQEAINGECHIRAPQVVTDADGGSPITAWPYTLHDGWCAEHEPKDIDKPDDTEGGA